MRKGTLPVFSSAAALLDELFEQPAVSPSIGQDAERVRQPVGKVKAQVEAEKKRI